MISFITLVFFSFTLISVVYSLKKWGPISPPTLFVTSAVIYNSLIPLELMLTGELSYSLSGRIYVNVTQEQCLAIVAMSLVANVSFLIGYAYLYDKVWLARSTAAFGALGASLTEANPPPIAFAFVSMVGFFILSFFYGENLTLSTSSYEANYTLIYSSSVYSFFLGIAQIYAVVAAIGFFRAKSGIGKILGVILILLPIFWGLKASDKNPMLLSFLGIALMFIKGKSLRHSVLYVLMVFAGMAVLPVFSAYRAGVSFSEMPAESFSLLPRDPKGPFVSLVSAIEGNLPVETHYLQSLATLIPRVLWPDRPLDAANVFAGNNIVNWIGGEGLGYSLLGESYYNFGYLFFLTYLMLGALYSLLGQLGGRTGLLPLITILMLYQSVLCHRSSLIGQAKEFVYFSVPAILILLFWNSSALKTETNPSKN